jgi:hypothetical protein
MQACRDCNSRLANSSSWAICGAVRIIRSRERDLVQVRFRLPLNINRKSGVSRQSKMEGGAIFFEIVEICLTSELFAVGGHSRTNRLDFGTTAADGPLAQRGNFGKS